MSYTSERRGTSCAGAEQPKMGVVNAKKRRKWRTFTARRFPAWKLIA